MATSFQFNFTEGENKAHEMNGYLQGIKSVLLYIQEVTAFNPQNRYIDSVALLDKITATSAAMQPLFSDELHNILKSLSQPLNKEHEKV